MKIQLCLFSGVFLLAQTVLAEPVEKKEIEITANTVAVAAGPQTEILVSAKETLQSLMNDKGGLLEKAALAEAECLAVFPNFKSAAVLIGGQHSDGVAVCKTKSSEWTDPAFVDLRGVSFGTQAGLETGSLVALFKNEKAAKELKEGKVNLGAEVGYIFDEKSKSLAANTTSPKDVVVYSNTKGMHAGALLKGSYIAVDDDENRAFYKDEKVTIASVLSTKAAEKGSVEVNELLLLLPKRS